MGTGAVGSGIARHAIFIAGLLLLLAAASSADTIFGNNFSGSDYGVYNNESRPLIANNTISGCGHGIYNYRSNSTIENNSIYSNNRSGVVNRDQSFANITAGNDISGNSLYGVVNINSTPVISDSIGNNTNGKILRAWYLRVQALNSTGSAVSGANVDINDNQSQPGAYDSWDYWQPVSPYPMTTNASGWTQLFIAYQNRTNNDSSGTQLTAHTIHGNKTGVGQGFKGVVMDASKEENVTLNMTVCSLSFWVDSSPGSTLANAGRPHNLTIGVTDSAGGAPVSGAIVHVEEDTGILPFALLQVVASNVSNTGRGTLTTGASGNATLTVVATGGGSSQIDSYLGAYTLRARVEVDGADSCSDNISIASRNYATSFSHIEIPSRSNIVSYKDDVYRVFNMVKLWLNLGGGENHNITIYTNGTATGMGFSVWSGKPTGMNVTVLNATDLSPVPNATINITESNGVLPWTLIQVLDSNVSPSGSGIVRTDANGNARFTLIPTGGSTESAVESAIGPYNITMDVYADNLRVYNSTITNSHRALDYTPSGSAEEVPNQANVASYKDDVYRLFRNILLWLSQ